MSSRIRGRRYRNVDPDERYGFTTTPASNAVPGASSEAQQLVEVVSLDGIPIQGTTVTMDGTSVTMDPNAPALEQATVLPELRSVTGPPRAEG